MESGKQIYEVKTVNKVFLDIARAEEKKAKSSCSVSM